MQIRDGWRHIKVTLLDPGPMRPFEIFWNWYRETWYSLRNVPYTGTAEQIAACLEVMAGTALPTPQEAICFQVRVEGLSRVALAQFTRGRVGWAYCVTSQMPEAIEHEVILPTNIYRGQYGEELIKIAKRLGEIYDSLVSDMQVPPQDARYITMHGQTTNLVCHVNYSALRGYFARRCENGLTDELNLIGRMIRRELINEHLSGSDGSSFTGWKHLIDRLDAMGGDQKCLNTDKVFGNTGRAKSSSPAIPSAIDSSNPCDWDFNKSAWYWELLSLPDELLFSGEREMIEDWRSMGFLQRLRKVELGTK